MQSHLLLALALGLAASPSAQAETYSFKVDGKYVNIVFESLAEFEDILGITHTVDGTVQLGGKGGGTFKLTVPVDSLRTGIDLRDEHLRSEGWLNVKVAPDIVFEGHSVRSLGHDRYELAGTFSLRGQTKPLKVRVEAHRIGKVQAAKAGMGEFNWLHVRGEFKVKLSDYGLQLPPIATGKVNDEWTVRLSLLAKETP